MPETCEFFIFLHSDFFHRQTHPYTHSSSAPHTETHTHPTHSVIRHFNTMKIFISFTMEPPTSFRLIPLALQPFMGFGFLKQVIPSFPIQCQFFPIFHIHHLHNITQSSHLILGLPVRSPLVSILIFFFTIHGG